MIMAGMRNWLSGGDLKGGADELRSGKVKGVDDKVGKGDRVIVVHCKAGKGRSGTMACSYLISECGWKPKDALARFTERRMRPQFGAGVSIPSQLRWISYVDRWTRGGKKYVDHKIEIVEVHVWGLRHGVKVAVEGFIEQGKKIQVLHTFKKEERIVVEGDAPGGGGITEFMSDMAGYGATEESDSEIGADADYQEIVGNDAASERSTGSQPSRSKSKLGSKTGSIMRKMSKRKSQSPSTIDKVEGSRTKTISMPADGPASPNGGQSAASSATELRSSPTFADASEPGGRAVIFKPKESIRAHTSDINISVERRNRTPGSMGLTMVTAVAHVWFNAFFEGQGPEQGGQADSSGVFEVDWDKMDGIKGSSRKGTRACDRIAVLWRTTPSEGTPGESGVVINEPGENSPVPQMEAADWKGDNKEDPGAEKRLGLRVADPESAEVSKASSIKSQEMGEGDIRDEDSLMGVKLSDPLGDETSGKFSQAESASGSRPQESSKDDPASATAQNGFIVE